MSTSPRTTTTTLLLEGLKGADNHAAWIEFNDRYVPMIRAFARTLGLSDADAGDIAQETLVRFLNEYRAGKYDRGRGRLRSWIISIARFRIADLRRRQLARREQRGASAVLEIPDKHRLTEIWDRAHRGALLRRALSELRETSRTQPRTLRAFELFVLEEQPAAQVAETLGMSAQEVYVAKNRVAERLREIVAKLESLYS